MERRALLYLSRSSNVTMPSFDRPLLDPKKADPHEAEVLAPVDEDDCVLEFTELLLPTYISSPLMYEYTVWQHTVACDLPKEKIN